MTLILSTPVMKNEEISNHKRLIALVCGLLFVSHPEQTQAVTYIVQRLASMAALFYLASLCFYLKARLTRGKYISLLSWGGLAVTTVLGMFSKETFYTLPFAILMFEFSFLHTEKLKEIILNRKILLYVIPAILLILIILQLLSSDMSKKKCSLLPQPK